MKKLLSEYVDVLVVGGGSAGAVVASRLSEDEQRQVLLLEAGPAKPESDVVAQAVRNANQPAVVAGLNWKLRTFIKSHKASQMQRGAASIFDYEAGRILGGSSAINAVQALRGAPRDFDDWALRCGESWSWKNVLPYFRKLEDDPVGSEEIHGRGGPLPIRRERWDELTPLQMALYEVCTIKGFAQTIDHNDPTATGVGVIPKNVVEGVRMSTAMTYLALSEGRKNLQVVAHAFVHRLLWEGTRCTGVLVEIEGELHAVKAKHVVLSAGAMSTPAILLRSGVGASPELKAHGIEVKVALSGVGEGLMDHPVVGIWGVPKPNASQLGEPLRQTLLRYSACDSGFKDDMHICMMAGIDVVGMFPHLRTAFGIETIAGITACFNRSTSRGSVRLASADPQEQPIVSLNCLGETSDIPPLKEGIRLAWELLQQPCLRDKFVQLLAWTPGMIQSEAALQQAVSTFVRPGAHACGSARMGRAPDDGDVVTPEGRVYGTEGLWIVDASIMPDIPSAPTNLTSIMLAEKISAEMRAVV